MNVLSEAGRVLVLLALALLVVLPAMQEAAHPNTADLAPRMSLSAHADDVQAEGTDVLPVAFHDAPPELWNGLIAQYPGAYDDVVPGIGTFYVPVGSVVDFHSPDGAGLFLATVDGFMVCIDHETFAGECSATGPVQPTSIQTRTATSVYDYMTNGTTAQCGGDAQCWALDADRQLAALGTMTDGAVQNAPRVVNVAYATSTDRHDSRGWRIASDGRRVRASYYSHVRGASQAMCDSLGKRRVPDDVFGHRCVR